MTSTVSGTDDSRSGAEKPEGAEILLVYDRSCPACNTYCKLIDVDANLGSLRLVNARESSNVMEAITSQGLDIDQGTVLKIGETSYYGADAIHALALIGTRSGFFNRLNYRIFGSRWISTALYPILRSLRNLLLKLLDRTKINNLGIPGNDRF